MIYVIEHGDVWLTEDKEGEAYNPLLSSKRHVCDGTDLLAIAFDEESGTLHKTGKADLVEKWASETSKKFIDAGFAEMASDIVVISFPVCADTVDEMNACRECSGRVLKLRDRLAEIAAVNPTVSRSSFPR